ncbi:hypothetical protein [Psychrobacter immobilis]|uniref:hypothetical protein n=1 Tax=Psychrobacter immobilis TaxID=498 RepID=UPI00191A5139|nr:hypothetical protein [Psychrobacter immobilis]
MRKIDEKFLMAVMIFTVAALVGYFVLDLIARKHISTVNSSIGAIEQAPLIVINTIQGYWWFGYLLLLGMLILKWLIKRAMS